ncbi:MULTISPECIES: hypothetical protein [unclassified Rickettsia]|uniref:hypothetical protein n=1 Tax=unclassified Rickettsia TaxID=114295 RepID=UPI003132ACE1
MDRKLIKNSSLRSHEVAAAIQAIPNVMRDLIRILNKFSIKICLTGLPRRHKCLLAMTILVAMQQRLRLLTTTLGVCTL